jgi:cytoskeletal protein CcmA (bactofilin family)
MTRARFFTCAIGTLLAALLGGQSHAGNSGDGMISRQLGNDTFATGGSVSLDEEIYGDAIAAGGEVTITAPVRGDALLAGGEVELEGTVDEDVYAAGGEVEVSGHVAGSARLAGGDIEVGSDAIIDGAVSIMGGDVTIDGRLGQYLQVAAGSTRIDGVVEGDVEVSGGELTLGPGAVINGSLTFRGPDAPELEEGATVRGEVQHIVEKEHKSMKAMFGLFGLLWLVGWLLVGWIVLALWPGFARAVVDTARQRTAASFVIGLALLVGVPALLVALAITLIGLPLALLLLCVYLLLLPLGYLAAAAAIGEWLLGRFRRGAEIATRHRVFMLLGVLVALFVVTRVPYLGGLVCFVVLLAGMGSLVLASVARHRAASAPA